MKTADYQSINKKLFDLNFAKKSRLDLNDISALYAQLCLKDYPKIHVAGTNGKGSCVAKLSSTLSLAGYRCGAFTSPHVATFRERITIDGEMISEQDTARIAELVFEFAEKLEIELTFFEVLTLIALKYFEEQEVDVAVIEVGLGGRLDATNCIHPILSVITSISFDHMHLLGDSLEKIASEKAGIIKDDVPLVTGPKANQNSILQKAQQHRSQHYKVLDKDFKSYDEENKAIARLALEQLKVHFAIDADHIEQGLKAKPRARFELHKLLGHEVILDMSHNPDGTSRLFKQIEHDYEGRPITVFTGLSQGHDYLANFEIIQKYSRDISIVKLDHPRLASPVELKQKIEAPLHFVDVNEIQSKVEKTPKNHIILFVGSIFIMHPIYNLLGISLPCDPYQIHDGVFKKDVEFKT